VFTNFYLRIISKYILLYPNLEQYCEKSVITIQYVANHKFEHGSHEQTTYINNVTLRSARFNRLWATNDVTLFILEWNNWRKGSWDSEQPYLQTWQHSHSQSHIGYKLHQRNWKHRNTIGTSVSQNVADTTGIPIKARNYLQVTKQLTILGIAQNTFPHDCLTQ
jgi:hypothetical protein